LLHLWAMNIDDLLQILFLLGLALIIVILLRQLGHRIRQNALKEQQRAAAVKAAHEAERKSMAGGSLPKAKRSMPKSRMPLHDPMGTPFTGAIQGQAAKWEAEIHQLGRQIIGQIDSKMAALQALTLDANRTANRLEIMVEHLEQVIQKQIKAQQELAQSTMGAFSATATELPSVIPATESVPAAPLAEVLKELTDDIVDFRNTVEQNTTFAEFAEKVEQATIFKVEEQEAHNLRREVEMLSNYGLKPQEIADRLNISIGEVDLILQVQQSRGAVVTN